MAIKSDYTYRNNLVKGLIPSKESILDIGGFREYESIFGDKYLSINIPDSYNSLEKKPHEYYDGISLPFQDKAFSTCIAVDTLEHIPKANRILVIEEMFRVAKRQVIVMCPYSSKDNVRKERELVGLMIKKGCSPKLSILEHIKFGLPRIEELEDYFNKYSPEIESINKKFVTHRDFFYQYFFDQVNRKPCQGNLVEERLSELDKEIKAKDAYRVVYHIRLKTSMFKIGFMPQFVKWKWLKHS